MRTYTFSVTMTTHPEYYNPYMNLALDADGDAVQVIVDDESRTIRVRRGPLDKPSKDKVKDCRTLDVTIGDITGRLVHVHPRIDEFVYGDNAKRLNLNMDGDVVLYDKKRRRYWKIYCGWKEPNKLTNWIKMQIFMMKIFVKTHLKF